MSQESASFVKLLDEQAKDKDVIFLKNRFLGGKNSNKITA